MVVAIGRFKLSRLTYSMSSEDASKWAASARSAMIGIGLFPTETIGRFVSREP
jgi:hypothetical protein